MCCAAGAATTILAEINALDAESKTQLNLVQGALKHFQLPRAMQASIVNFYTRPTAAHHLSPAEC